MHLAHLFVYPTGVDLLSDANNLTIANQAVSRTFKITDRQISTAGFTHIETGGTLTAQFSNEFVLHFEDGTTVVPSECELVSCTPTDSSLALEYQGVLTHQDRSWSLQISVEYDAPSSLPVLRKRVRASANGPTPPPPIVAMDVESLGVAREVCDDRIGWKGTDADSPYRLGQPVAMGAFFGGLEYPAGLNGLLDGEDTVSFRHFPMWQQSAPERYQVASKVAVIGGIGPSGLQHSFMEYLNTRRKLPGDQYEVWFNTFWSEPKVHAPGEVELPAEMIESLIASAQKHLIARGINVDALLLDAGWQRRDALCQPRDDTFPDDMAALRARLNEIGTGIGIWLSSNGGLMLDKEWARSKGYRIGTGPGAMYGDGPEFVSLADAKWREDFTSAVTEFISHQPVNAIKWDWENEMAADADIKANFPTPRHLREHAIDGLLQILDAVRSVRPEIRFRAGLWQSPWWLLHADWVFLHDSADYEFATLPSLSVRDRAMTSRDASYYRHYRTQRSIFPLSNLNIFEFVQGWRMPVPEDGPTWSKACVMNMGRGHALLDLYLSPPLMSDEKWETLCEAITWAQSHSHLLLSSRTEMILGDPAEGEVYGFLHSGERQTLSFMRNPGVESASIDLPLSLMADRLNQAEIIRYEIIYPYRKVLRTPPTSTKLRMGAGEVLVLQASVEEHSTRPKEPILTNCRFRSINSSDGTRSWHVWPDDAQAPVELSLPSGETRTVQLHSGFDGPYPSSADVRITSRQTRDGKARIAMLVVLPARLQHPELWVKLLDPSAETIPAFSIVCRQKRGWSEAPLRGEHVHWGVHKHASSKSHVQMYARFDLAGPGENHLVLEVTTNQKFAGTVELSAWVRAAPRPHTVTERIDGIYPTNPSLSYPGDPVMEEIDLITGERISFVSNS